MKKLIFILFFIPMNGFCQDLTITISSNVAVMVLTDFSNHFGYQTIVQDPLNPGATIQNPITRLQFSRQFIASYIKGIVIDEEAKQAVDQARQNAINNGNNSISITAP